MRKCKSETAEYHREWYATNKEKRREQIKKWQDKRVSEWKEFKSTLKCIICSESESCCLDFHHINPLEKDEQVSIAARRWSQKRLEKELDKCVVLCSNCHRKVHAGVIQLEE